MNLTAFLTNYLNKLRERKIPYCILRNYEELPQKNSANDIDILIRPGDTSTAIEELANITDIKITECCQREYLTSLFIFGVNWGEGYHAIQLDLFTSLSWKGLPYLNIDKVIKEARPLSDAIDIIIAPYAVHEAIISFFSSYLVGGWIKERYQSKVQRIFISNKEEIITLLGQIANINIVKRVVDSVCADSYVDLLNILPRLRWSIFFNSFRNAPLFTLKIFLRHHFKEMRIRFTQTYINEIVVFGPDGSGKSSVIAEAKKKLLYTTKMIKIQHLRPRILRITKIRGPVSNPHAAQPRSSFASVLKVLLWSLEYWIKKIFHGYKNPTLVFWDRYFNYLLLDPKRYRYGGPMWLVQLFSRIVPMPNLVILLDAPAEVLQSRKKEVSYAEAHRQREAYLKLVGSMDMSIVINASQSIDRVVKKTNEVILKFKVERVKKRF